MSKKLLRVGNTPMVNLGSYIFNSSFVKSFTLAKGFMQYFAGFQEVV